ncbi:hypothetical protein QJ854_gp013 [Moumouvirus goulette]|uniref:Uncharacterized protein n=1 Tax=Moumouvirus goulette TaxID=1247379 RepID=M1PCN9_9VIRU|nr:hypothetical protein QJ854_gp013 [Moumouvirus goulette]AGF85769.1 hypothetical protein glt_00966 [Moumouvirus goulette]
MASTCIENLDFYSEKIFPQKKKNMCPTNSTRLTKRSKNSKSRVLSEKEKTKLVLREKKYLHKLQKKNIGKDHAFGMMRKIIQKIDVEALNEIEDDVVINPEEDDIDSQESISGEEKINTPTENVPCGSGVVCDEWSGGYFWVKFYKTKPDFKPYSTGNWHFDEWDRGYYFD